jgi:hypothetical protein
MASVRTMTSSTYVPRILAGIVAASTLVGGFAHLMLYNDGYKDIPVGNIGPQFLLNAVGAVAIAAGLIAAIVVQAVPAWVGKLALVAGVAWGAVSLTAFFVARTSGGWFGFVDQPGLNPSPEAAMAVVAESVTVALGLVLLAALLIRPETLTRHAPSSATSSRLAP